ncbi:MAG: metallophosphoesterase [Deltaproteobacteria bacterium]|nr:metallophosphoesterase [Deltaproteobacteria bacterium]
MSVWNPYVFPVVVLALWAGLHVYAWFRIRWTVKAGPAMGNSIAIVLILLACLYPFGRFLVDRLDARSGLLVLWPGSVYLGFFLTATTIMLVFDGGFSLPCLVLRRLGVLGRRAAALAETFGRVALPVAGAVSVVLCVMGVMNVFESPPVTRIEKVMPGLPPQLDGFRLVQVSDIHAGYLAGAENLDKVAARVKELDADLVVVTGDLVDDPMGGDGTAIREIASLPARYGVLAVTGNHEYRTGAENTVYNMRRNGLTLLRQENRVIAGGLVVAGVDDMDFLGGLLGTAPALLKALQGAPANLPVVLLSHRPVKWDVAAHAGVDLMLCGHTHGGQVFPLHLVLKRIYDGFLSGRYEIGGMTLYVNNGVGFWGPPMRIMADPEVLLVTLRSTGGK